MTAGVALLLGSCGLGSYEGRPDDDPVPQTEILRFELTPDTVATEDTVLIHCVIEDSLDERFEYRWKLGSDTLAVNGTILGPRIRWIAPDLNISQGEVQESSAGIIIDNGSRDSAIVEGSFQIPVIKK